MRKNRVDVNMVGTCCRLMIDAVTECVVYTKAVSAILEGRRKTIQILGSVSEPLVVTYYTNL